jgi:hypothetical protein
LSSDADIRGLLRRLKPEKRREPLKRRGISSQPFLERSSPLPRPVTSHRGTGSGDIWLAAGVLSGILARLGSYGQADRRRVLNDALIFATARKFGMPLLRGTSLTSISCFSQTRRDKFCSMRDDRRRTRTLTQYSSLCETGIRGFRRVSVIGASATQAACTPANEHFK